MKRLRISRKNYNSLSLSKKLHYVIMSLVIPLVVCMILMVTILVWYTHKYSVITHNVNISSKFSINFKENMDLKMYYYMVGSKEQKELPIEDVEEAIEIAQTLQDTTQRKESRLAIKNVLDYCQKLEKNMHVFEETVGYDSREEQLNKNIYVLTDLIQGKMMDYIYYEAGYLSMLEKQVMSDLLIIIVFMVIMVIGLVLLVLYRSLNYTEEIVRPIGGLCSNVSKVSDGDFAIEPVKTNAFEIAHLDEGIRDMAKKIEMLLENVKQEERLQHKIQLQMLREQINPHFLYNTLDTIVWMVEAKMHEDAVKMLSSLSNFFRTALSKGADIIPLQEEISHTKSYLEIQQARYRDVLEYRITLPSQIGDVLIPKLTLQPLVENALYHGVREKRGKSRITVAAEEQGDDICILVADNGIGITPEHLEQVRQGLDAGEKVGFGLSAVQSRLKLYFGEEYGIVIDSVYEEGTRVKISVPKKMNETDKKM